MTEEIIGSLDFVQLEAVRHKRLEVHPSRGDGRHQATHALFAAGAQARHNRRIGQAGRERAKQNSQVRRVDTEAG
jgi:hypothetical protein